MVGNVSFMIGLLNVFWNVCQQVDKAEAFWIPLRMSPSKSTSRHVDPLEVLVEFWGHDDVLPMGTSQWGEGRLTDVATDPGTSAFQERLPLAFRV